jgi:3',5'-cyclic-AMP phosphodiesterase
MVIVQITDLHLRPFVEANAKRLKQVVRSINETLKPDCIVVTGDLVDDGREIGAYQLLRTYLDQLTSPYYLIPGNHDDQGNLKKVWQDVEYVNLIGSSWDFLMDQPHWPFVVIGLDSVKPGETFGKVTEHQVNWLNHVCATTTKPIILGLHHPPLTKDFFQKVIGEGIPLPDGMLEAVRFQGVDLLHQAIASFSQIKLVMCGHVHLGAKLTCQGKTLISSPSVAPAFSFLLDHADELKERGIEIPKKPGMSCYTWKEPTQDFSMEFMFC